MILADRHPSAWCEDCGFGCSFLPHPCQRSLRTSVACCYEFVCIVMLPPCHSWLCTLTFVVGLGFHSKDPRQFRRQRHAPMSTLSLIKRNVFSAALLAQSPPRPAGKPRSLCPFRKALPPYLVVPGVSASAVPGEYWMTDSGSLIGAGYWC